MDSTGNHHQGQLSIVSFLNLFMDCIHASEYITNDNGMIESYLTIHEFYTETFTECLMECTATESCELIGTSEVEGEGRKCYLLKQRGRVPEQNVERNEVVTVIKEVGIFSSSRHTPRVTA